MPAPALQSKIYTQARIEAKRQAQQRLVQTILPEENDVAQEIQSRSDLTMTLSWLSMGRPGWTALPWRHDLRHVAKQLEQSGATRKARRSARVDSLVGATGFEPVHFHRVMNKTAGNA